jgi:hypothetical protein
VAARARTSGLDEAGRVMVERGARAARGGAAGPHGGRAVLIRRGGSNCGFEGSTERWGRMRVAFVAHIGGGFIRSTQHDR